MLVVTCEDDTRYGFDFGSEMRVTKSGKVKCCPYDGVKATLEFPSRAVKVEESNE